MTRAEWLAERRNGIGASDAAAILGVSPFKSALNVYVDKIGIDEPDEEETEAQEWGHRLEPVIAAKYQQTVHRPVWSLGDNHIVTHPDLPWCRATPDRMTAMDPGASGYPVAPAEGEGVLELKTASFFKKDEWLEEPPLEYQVQVQHQLAVTGKQWGSIAVLIGGQRFKWADIKRHDAFIAKLLEAEEAFWLRVLRRDPPPPAGTEQSARALAVLYPQQQGEPISLGNDVIDLDDELVHAKEMVKLWEGRELAAENKIKALIGAAPMASLPNGVRYKWVTEPRAGHVVKPSEPRVFRRLKPKGK